VLVQVEDPRTAKAVLDGYVESVLPPDGATLAVRVLPVAEVTRRLVVAGVSVHEAIAERRTLEDVVLSLTGPGSDRVDGAGRTNRPRRRDGDGDHQGSVREMDLGSLFEPRDRVDKP
jgi:hypothetical protein